ncbi:sensor histidine kinase [Malonomonas rubra]|uniref:sensor histidine kinase n=1 Tax=Malonomonas rubra TaxID=57040 RepID=UPI0026EBF8E0|nr:sensor histidine kinase [Malonomonas rubra]
MLLVFSLLQQMSVFMVIAYLFTKSPAFRPLTAENLQPRQKLILYFVFSAFSILGTYFGLPVSDAIANTRAIGAVLAGLIGGPALGLAVGLTGGLHRFSLGGFTAFACGVSTTTEGLIGGLFHLYLMRQQGVRDVFNPKIAFVATLLAESLQMLIILALARPFAEALALVEVISLPMILANSVGAALFISIMRDRKQMVDEVGATFSAKALKVAEKTLGLLSCGFNAETAGEMVEIIRAETGVGAVAVTDREKHLAFSGAGADHHLPGLAIASEYVRRAIQQHRVVYVDGINEPFNCPHSRSCPLGSALVVPLAVHNEVLGTIILFEPKTKLFLNNNRSLGEGLASLLSEQLLRSRYESQQNMLTKSELKLVQAQVNPHFLFNALNTIIAIIEQDAQRAKELTLHLSNFFRKNLKRSGDLATLEEELDHVNSYLTIERARFEDRLVVETEISPELLSIKLPTFTLQPIIENSIKHGISQIFGTGIVKVRAVQSEGQIRIEVEDNAGTYCEKLQSDGLGMNLVDKRIKNLYGDQYGISVACVPEEKTLITISVPQGERP